MFKSAAPHQNTLCAQRSKATDCPFLLSTVPLCLLTATATEGAILTSQELTEIEFFPSPIKIFERFCLTVNTVNDGRKETQTCVIKLKR